MRSRYTTIPVKIGERLYKLLEEDTRGAENVPDVIVRVLGVALGLLPEEGGSGPDGA